MRFPATATMKQSDDFQSKPGLTAFSVRSMLKSGGSQWEIDPLALLKESSMTPPLLRLPKDAPAVLAAPSVETRRWWSKRRWRYNLGLLIAGPMAFAAQIAAVSWGRSTGALPPPYDPDEMLVLVITTPVAYILAMLVANLCYFIGPWSEAIVKPTAVDKYRKITFRLGFWFSVLLPFLIPAQTTWFCLIHPHIDWRSFHG